MFDKEQRLLKNDPINGGTYDINPPGGTPNGVWRHYEADVRTWIAWGNQSEANGDTTSVGERYIAWLKAVRVAPDGGYSAGRLGIGGEDGEKVLQATENEIKVIKNLLSRLYAIDPSLKSATTNEGKGFALAAALCGVYMMAAENSHPASLLTKAYQALEPFPSQNGSVKFISEWSDVNSLVTAAKASMAVRYALLHNLPFVVDAGEKFYAPFNQNGELDYGPGHPAGITDEYLRDRALFLAAQSAYWQEHAFVFSSSAPWTDYIDDELSNTTFRYFTGEGPGTFDVYFEDRATGIKLPEKMDVPHYIFGTDRSDTYDGSGYHVVQHVYGGAGNDIIITGDGDDYIEGMVGDDYLDARGGTNVLIGGAGNDIYVIDPRIKAVNTIIDDGENRLRVYESKSNQWQTYSGYFTRSSNDSNTFTSADGQASFTFHSPATLSIGESTVTFQNQTSPSEWRNAFGIVLSDGLGEDAIVADMSIRNLNLGLNFRLAERGAHIIGGRKNDNITGSSFNDRIETGDGASSIVLALAGDDRIDGGSGTDYIRAGISGTGPGQTDNDMVQGYGGSDIIYGGAGLDFLYGTHAGDDIETETAASKETGDWMAGEDGADVIYGSNKGDFLFGGGDGDRIFAGAGNDLILGDGHCQLTLQYQSLSGTLNGKPVAREYTWNRDAQELLQSNSTVLAPRALVFQGWGWTLGEDYDFSLRARAALSGLERDAANGGDDWIDAGSGNDYVDSGSSGRHNVLIGGRSS